MRTGILLLEKPDKILGGGGGGGGGGVGGGGGYFRWTSLPSRGGAILLIGFMVQKPGLKLRKCWASVAQVRLFLTMVFAIARAMDCSGLHSLISIHSYLDRLR